MQIAQPAGAFLQIGFEVVVRFNKARMALLLLFLFGEVKSARIEMLRQRVAQLYKQRAGAGDQTPFQQVGLYRYIGGFRHALGYGADAVSDFEADVPQQSDQFFQELLQFRIRISGKQDQQVDVGLGVQLTAPVAAHRNQCQVWRHGKHLPGCA